MAKCAVLGKALVSLIRFKDILDSRFCQANFLQSSAHLVKLQEREHHTVVDILGQDLAEGMGHNPRNLLAHNLRLHSDAMNH